MPVTAITKLRVIVVIGCGVLIHLQGNIRHIIGRYSVEKGGVIVCGRDKGVRAIDTRLASGVDTVLSLPYFNQPGSAVVVKVDDFVVEYHIEISRRAIVEMGVSEGLARFI